MVDLLCLLRLFRDHAQDTSVTHQGETYAARESKSQNPSLKDLVKSVRNDDSETVAHHGKEPSVHWAPGNSAYLPSGQDEPNAYTYLPTVLEEPSSSFSEGVVGTYLYSLLFLASRFCLIFILGSASVIHGIS